MVTLLGSGSAGFAQLFGAVQALQCRQVALFCIRCGLGVPGLWLDRLHIALPSRMLLRLQLQKCFHVLQTLCVALEHVLLVCGVGMRWCCGGLCSRWQA